MEPQKDLEEAQHMVSVQQLLAIIIQKPLKIDK